MKSIIFLGAIFIILTFSLPTPSSPSHNEIMKKSRVKRNRSWWHDEFRAEISQGISQIKADMAILSQNIMANYAQSNSRMRREFAKIQTALFLSRNGAELDQKLEGCALNLNLGDAPRAIKIWDDLLAQILPPERVDFYVGKIFDKVHLTAPSSSTPTPTSQPQLNMGPLLTFLRHVKSPLGFEKMFEKLLTLDLIFGGRSEIFLLAHAFRSSCGGKCGKKCPSFPPLVKKLFFTSVRIRNLKTMEYIRRPFDNSLRVTSEIDLAGSWTLDLMEEDGRFVLQSKLFYVVIQPPPTLKLTFELVDKTSFRIKIVGNEGEPGSVGRYLGSLSQNGHLQVNVSRSSAGEVLEYLTLDPQHKDLTRWTVEEIKNSSVVVVTERRSSGKV